MKDENLMSQSLVSLHGMARGRKRHTELTPVALPRERIFASSTGRINKDSNKTILNDSSAKSTPKRAVSMTRLDQLAQPRRRYLEESLKSNNSLSGNNTNDKSLTDCLTAKSMSNLNITNNNKIKNKSLNPSPSPRQSPLRKGRFKSMTHLLTNNQTTNTSNKMCPKINTNETQNSYFCKQNKEKSKSMVQLSARPPPPPPPRQTRASKLRTEKSSLRNARSSLTLNTDCK